MARPAQANGVRRLLTPRNLIILLVLNELRGLATVAWIWSTEGEALLRGDFAGVWWEVALLTALLIATITLRRVWRARFHPRLPTRGAA